LQDTRAAETMGGMIVVREVSPDEWESLREVRLAALRDAPHAFGSAYAWEAPFTQEQWRGRINDRSVTFFAYLPGIGEPAGLAGVYVPAGIPDVVSMWVRPSARGNGAGEALITAAVDWARARDHDALFLWVTESNAPARALYERCGFAPTGEKQPLPSDPELTEIRMQRLLLPPPVTVLRGG
jgi:GNAT superfamily N-acetyltransferase